MLSLISGMTAFSIPAATQAAPVKAYAAFETSRTDFTQFLMAPGAIKNVTLTFKNTGTKTWAKNGSSRVAINTFPQGRISKFQDKSWSSSYRPAKPNESTIKSSGTATFTFKLKAPAKKGEYIERFSLARLPGVTIPGGEIAFAITVGDKESANPLYRGKATAVSENAYDFKPGEGKTLWIEYQNTGRLAWARPATNPIVLETANPRLRTSDFALKWMDPGHPNQMRESKVKSGERVRIYFALMAPKTEGAFVESFQLAARGLTAISGTQVDLNIMVRDPNKPPTPAGVITEPNVRVGITYLNQGVTVKPTTHHVFTHLDGTTIAEGAANAESTITYVNGIYSLNSGGATYTSTQGIRITPDAEGITAIVNYRTNFDAFRNIIEIRYATATKRLWVINELPMDLYLQGLAEAVTGQHLEYMKSLAVAARSYALWHWYVSRKHANENFTINATTDQVYRGYNYELKTPDFVQAVQDTRGIVMTHPSAGFDKNPLNIALGAYSSGTDGYTRDFTEVWGGKPEDWAWMVSVEDPLGIIPDALTRPGNHMVGMSATGALRYAVREGRTFDWILMHYYTGIALQKLW